MKPVISYAQNREDIILSAFFKDGKKGFYVDVGAFDPTIDSVTQYFYERGWRGINVEPNKQLYKKFVASRKNDINVNKALSDEVGTVVLREYLDGLGLSTIDKTSQLKYEESEAGITSRYVDVEVQTDTLANILAANNVESINFLKVDVEGNEYRVLAGNDWEKYRPDVICIESNHIVKDWHALLDEHEYEVVFFDGLNEYFVDKRRPEIKAGFNYISMVIGRDIIFEKDREQRLSMEKDIAGMRSSVERLIQQNVKASERIAELNNVIREGARFRNQLKGLIAAFDNVVSVRIAKLNPTRYNHARIEYSSTSSPASLVKIAHEADLKTFGKRKGNIIRRVLYVLLNFIHKVFKKLVWLAGKAAKKLYKRLKRTG